jgi:hypothetical protein
MTSPGYRSSVRSRHTFPLRQFFMTIPESLSEAGNDAATSS